MNYSQFISACKEAWATEGHGSIDIQIAHAALLAVEKKPGMSKMAIAKKAWLIYRDRGVMGYYPRKTVTSAGNPTFE